MCREYLWLGKHVCTKLWPHFEKQNVRHSQLFQDHKDALNLKILQLASSNLHKRYMARKASLIVISAYFAKQNGRHITCLMSNGVILLKGLISPLPLLLGVWDVKTIFRKSRPWNISQVLNLTFDPCFKVKWGHHTKTSLYLHCYWC